MTSFAGLCGTFFITCTYLLLLRACATTHVVIPSRRADSAMEMSTSYTRVLARSALISIVVLFGTLPETFDEFLAVFHSVHDFARFDPA